MSKAIRRLLIYAAIVVLGGLLGANVYNSVVDAPNWGASIPDSLAAAKAYFAAANPGTFYRLVSPAAQVAAVIAIIAAWPAGKRVRILAAAALALALSGDILTFAYFYPRNAILFGPGTHDAETLREAWAGWSSMNWFRSLICLLALMCELGVLSGFEVRLAARSDAQPS